MNIHYDPMTDMTHSRARGSLIRRRLGVGAAFLALAAGCSVGPDYKRPEVKVPVSFKESPGWKVAAPDDGAIRGPWWELFNDPVLNSLEARIETSKC